MWSLTVWPCWQWACSRPSSGSQGRYTLLWHSSLGWVSLVLGLIWRAPTPWLRHGACCLPRSSTCPARSCSWPWIRSHGCNRGQGMHREDIRQQNRRVLVIVITIFVLLFVVALIRILTR